MKTGIVFFLLFLLSFVVLPFGATDFETPKVILAEIGVILLLLVQSLQNTFRVDFKTPPIMIVGVLLLVSLMDLFYFKSSISFFGNNYRMQGIFLLWILLTFALVSKKIDFKKIHWLIFAGIVLVQFLLLFFFGQNESNRYIGSFGEPNALAAFALFVWPFSFFAVKRFGKKEIAAQGILLIIIAAIIYLSGSRSAIIGFVIQLVWLLSLKYKNVKGKIFLLCLLIYIVSYITPFIFQTTYENRAEVWHAAANAFLERPFLGYGFGNAETALHTSAHQLGLPVQYYYVDSSHNIFLDFAVEGGVFALLSIVGLVIITIRNFFLTTNTQNLTIFFGLLTVLSFNPASVVGLLGIWWLIGQGIEANKV